MGKPVRCLAALLLTVCLGCLAAQEGTVLPDEILIRPVPMFFHFAPDSGFNPQQRRLLMESLVMTLGAASAEVSLHPRQLESEPSDGELDSLATDAGADAWLDVAIAGGMEAATIRFHARDLANARDFFRREVSAAIDTRFRDAFGGLWAPVARLIRETIHPYRQYNLLEIRGPSGSRLSLDGHAPLALDAGGSATLRLASPSSHGYSLYLPGRRLATGTLFIEQDGILEIAPAARWPISLSAGLEWLTMPALSIQADIIPDTLCLELSAVAYPLNLDPGLPADAATPNGLVNLLAGLRWQFLEHRGPFRISAGAGGHARFLTAGWLRPDPLAPGGWYLLGGVSWDISPELALFLDHVPRFTWSPDPTLCLSALAGRSGLPIGNLSFTAGDILVEAMHFSVGLRFQP
jgi:hypothetical protein